MFRHRDADGGVPRAVLHSQIIAAQPAGHVGHFDHIARRQRGEAFAHQVEIGDAVDLIVIGDTRVAVAKADFGPHIDFDIVTTRGRGAMEGPPGGPSIRRTRR